MDESIQDFRRLLHHFLGLLRQHLILQRLAVQDQVQGVVIVRHLGVDGGGVAEEEAGEKAGTAAQ